MQYRKKVLGIMVAGILMATSMAYAQATEPAAQAPVSPAEMQAKAEPRPECQCPPRRAHKRLMWKLAYQLSLNEDQARQLEVFLDKQKDTMKASFEQMRNLKEALEEELTKPSLDMNKINQLHGQLKGIQAQMADARLNAALEARKILNPEQYDRFVDLMQKPNPWKKADFAEEGRSMRWQPRHRHHHDDESGEYGWRPRRPHHENVDEDMFDEE